MCKNIAVFFGGVSSENEISVITGTMVCNVLKRGGQNVLPIYITQGGNFLCGEMLFDIKNFSDGKIPASGGVAFSKGGIYVLSKRGKAKKFIPISCAINCCHGGWGEGGGICGLCAAMSIPLASAGMFESALFIDKYLTKIALNGLGVNTVGYMYLTDMDGAKSIENFPVMIKPARLGSSIGVAKAENHEQLVAALSAAFVLDSSVIVERYIENRREINCAACLVGDEVKLSSCEEVFGGEILSYDDKYSGEGRRVCPAEISETLAREIFDTTRKVYVSLKMSGIVRFDYILEDQNVYLSEVNTVPGSLSQYLLSDSFDEFYSLLMTVIGQSCRQFKEENSKMLINTGIINNFASNACKIK